MNTADVFPPTSDEQLATIASVVALSSPSWLLKEASLQKWGRIVPEKQLQIDDRNYNSFLCTAKVSLPVEFDPKGETFPCESEIALIFFLSLRFCAPLCARKHWPRNHFNFVFVITKHGLNVHGFCGTKPLE